MPCSTDSNSRPARFNHGLKYANANMFDLESFIAREVAAASAGIAPPHTAGGRLSSN
jgi:hypothetical protein